MLLVPVPMVALGDAPQRIVANCVLHCGGGHCAAAGDCVGGDKQLLAHAGDAPGCVVGVATQLGLDHAACGVVDPTGQHAGGWIGIPGSQFQALGWPSGV